jgi:hypothetical protein
VSPTNRTALAVPSRRGVTNKQGERRNFSSVHYAVSLRSRLAALVLGVSLRSPLDPGVIQPLQTTIDPIGVTNKRTALAVPPQRGVTTKRTALAVPSPKGDVTNKQGERLIDFPLQINSS